jgi:hypothetical protein
MCSPTSSLDGDVIARACLVAIRAKLPTVDVKASSGASSPVSTTTELAAAAEFARAPGRSTSPHGLRVGLNLELGARRCTVAATARR